MMGTKTTTGVGGDAAVKNTDRTNKIFTPIINCIREINSNEIGNAMDLDVMVCMYNLPEHSENYAKTLGNLWQQPKDHPNNNIKFKAKILGKKPAGGNKKELN